MSKLRFVFALVALAAALAFSAGEQPQKTQPKPQEQQAKPMGHMGMQGMDMMKMCEMMMDHSDPEMTRQCISMMTKGRHRESMIKALQNDKDLLASLKSIVAEAEKVRQKK